MFSFIQNERTHAFLWHKPTFFAYRTAPAKRIAIFMYSRGQRIYGGHLSPREAYQRNVTRKIS
jgi:hypothetical protein